MDSVDHCTVRILYFVLIFCFKDEADYSVSGEIDSLYTCTVLTVYCRFAKPSNYLILSKLESSPVLNNK